MDMVSSMMIPHHRFSPYPKALLPPPLPFSRLHRTVSAFLSLPSTTTPASSTPFQHLSYGLWPPSKPLLRGKRRSCVYAGLSSPSSPEKKRVESDSISSEVRERAMTAVDELGRRVTVGDVASKGGLKISQAEMALQALAADTGGFLEVNENKYWHWKPS